MTYCGIFHSSLIAGILAVSTGLASAAGVSDYAAGERPVSDDQAGIYSAQPMVADSSIDVWGISRPVRHNPQEIGIDLQSRERAQDSWLRCTDAFAKKQAGALATCQRAAGLDPANPYIWNTIGGIFEQRRQRQKAEDAYAKMLKTALRQDNPTAQIISLSNLANMSANGKDCRRATVFADKAVNLGERNDRREWLAPVMNIQATCLTRKGKKKAAVAKLREALALSKRFERKLDSARTYTNLGKINMQMKRLVLAESAFKDALKLYRDADINVKVAESFYRLAHIAVLKRDYPVAESYLLSSLRQYRAARHERGVQTVTRLIAKLSRRNSAGDVATGNGLKVETRSQKAQPKLDTKAWNKSRRQREYRIDGRSTKLFEISYKPEAQ